MAQEQQVGLQQDALTTAPMGVRTVVVTTMINGVPTPVQMQVVSIADSNGVLLEQQSFHVDRKILEELQQIRRMLCQLLGVLPMEDDDLSRGPENSGL